MIIISEEADDTTRETEYAVTHADGNFGHVIIKADPCLTHSLSVKMSNTSEKMETKVYNEKMDKYLYSGMLGQLVRDACLKDEVTVSIPDPPDAIRSCIRTSGEQKLESDKSGNTVIKLKILSIDPKKKESETVCIKVVTSGIKKCKDKEHRVAIINVTRVHLDECQNENGVNLAAAIVIPLLLVALIITGVLIFLDRKRLHRNRILAREWFCTSEKCVSSLDRFAEAFRTCCSCRQLKRKEEADMNPTYGDYEYEDGTLRKNTMEMIDNNEDYDQTVVRKIYT